MAMYLPPGTPALRRLAHGSRFFRRGGWGPLGRPSLGAWALPGHGASPVSNPGASAGASRGLRAAAPRFPSPGVGGVGAPRLPRPREFGFSQFLRRGRRCFPGRPSLGAGPLLCRAISVLRTEPEGPRRR